MKKKNKERIVALAIATGLFAAGFAGGALGFKLTRIPLHKPSITTPNEDPTDDTTINEDPIIEQEPSTTLPFLQETFPDVFKPEETIPETTIPEETIPEETVVVHTNDIVYATTNVNLRTAPTMDSIIIASLEEYDTVERLAQGPEWSLVKFDDQLAFASNDYLQPTETSLETEVKHTLKNDIVITTVSLNYRKQPDKESERILTFDENTELQVLAETDNGWLLVKSNNILGYVKKDYTISMYEMLNNIYPDLVEDLTLQKVVYATQDLNVRSGASIEAEAIGLLERLESVRVYGEFGDWYLIMTNNNDFGFIHKDYTQELDEEFVIVDLDKQTLYLYNGTDQYIQTPITSGKDSTPSDKGLFKIFYKSRNTPLIGDDYNVTVDYWMNYNNGEGLHDASWRSVFGTDSYHYNGSHGCINIPPHLADDVYEYTEKGTKVLVHK